MSSAEVDCSFRLIILLVIDIELMIVLMMKKVKNPILYFQVQVYLFHNAIISVIGAIILIKTNASIANVFSKVNPNKG